MYYALIKNNELIGVSECLYLNEDIKNIEITQEIYENIDKYIYSEGNVVENPDYEEQQKQIEHLRIQKLSMTRSDFFDGTIKAFCIDSSDLLPAIENILNNLDISSTDKKIAINNYKNALNFYRNHTLFTLLSNIPIKITEDLTITITEEQWDKFFDETNKKNPEAYKELL